MSLFFYRLTETKARHQTAYNFSFSCHTTQFTPEDLMKASRLIISKRVPVAQYNSAFNWRHPSNKRKEDAEKKL